MNSNWYCVRFLSSYVSGWLGIHTITVHALGDTGSSAGGITTMFPTYNFFESSYNSHNYCNYYSNFIVEATEVQRHSVTSQGHRTSE